MTERRSTEDRRASERYFKRCLPVLFWVAVISCGLQAWTFVTLQRGIKQSAVRDADLYHKIELANTNDDVLADQIAILSKELKLSQQEHDLILRQSTTAALSK